MASGNTQRKYNKENRGGCGACGLRGLAFLSCATISNSKRPGDGRSRDANCLAQLGDHPLRIALDKLQTLDTVRIIEGKA